MTTECVFHSMNWSKAVALAQEGFAMRRAADKVMRVLDPGSTDLQGEHWRDGIDHAPILESGHEGFRVMHAWTVDEKPVTVFVGSGSKCLFVPDDEMRAATDWEVE